MRSLIALVVLLLALPAISLQVIIDQFPYSEFITLNSAGLAGSVHRVREYTSPPDQFRKATILARDLTFDDKGRLVLEIENHSQTGERLWKHYYAYDDQGRLIKASSFGSYVGLTGAACIYSYDDTGRLITRTTLNADGSVKYLWNAPVQVSDQIIPTTHAPVDQIVNSPAATNSTMPEKHTIPTVDSAGRIISSLTYTRYSKSDDGTEYPSGRITYHYHPDGNLYEEITETLNARIAHPTVQFTVQLPKAGLDKLLHTHSTPTTQPVASPPEEIWSTRRTCYDAHGNWISKRNTGMKWSAVMSYEPDLTERVIEYY